MTLVTLAFASCQKENESVEPNSLTDGSTQRSSGSGSVIGPVPATFTQYALIENFTSARAGNAPGNDYMISQAQTAYPGRVVSTAFHLNDAMQGTPSFAVKSFLVGSSNPTLPAVAQNRITYAGKILNESGTWMNNLNATMGTTANSGMAMQTSVQGNYISGSVHVGFNATLSGSYKLVAYLVQQSVQGTGTGYDQSNNDNTNPSSPFFGMGNPIANYAHRNVVRQLLTSIDGISIPSSYLVPGGHMIQSIGFDLNPSVSTSDAYIVTYVYNTATKQVLNVQTARVGTVKNWN